MMSQIHARPQVAGFKPANRPRAAGRFCYRTVAALPAERVQQAVKAAGASVLAAVVALSLSAPAEATVTYGRKAESAAREASYADVLSRLDEAFESSQKAAATAQKKAAAAVDGVAGAGSSSATAAKPGSQQVPV